MTPTKRIKARLIPVDDKDLDEAEEIRRVKSAGDFSSALLTEHEFMSIKVPERKHLIRGLIVEETITIVNGFRGSGKSWFMWGMGEAVSWGDRIGPWDVEEPMNALLIDGEMPLRLLQERKKLMNVGRNIKDKPAEFFVYPEAYAYRIGLRRANILDPKWRDGITKMVEELGIKMLILDNLSSLAPGIDENDKMSFDEVNRWLLTIRFGGVAIIMTHHTGKNGEQRGTSAHEDHVDTALLLKRPSGFTKDMGCAFKVTATKDRDFVLKGKEYTLKLGENRQGRLVFEEDNSKTAKARMAGSLKEAREMGISDRTYYRIMKERNE